MVSCLEASEMGYDFVKICSRCDYYLQNRSLNNKALTLPQSQLSKLWQCTSLHKVGDLFHSQYHMTPYQPVIAKKSNAFICSDRASRSSSASKRVRLFESSTPKGNEDNEIPCFSEKSLEKKKQQQQHDSMAITMAIAERNMAFSDRDKAVAEKDKAVSERDFAFLERDKAYSKADAVKVECYKAIVDRDHALNNLSSLVQESKFQAERIAELNNEVVTLRREIEDLVKKKRQTDELIPVYEQEQSQLIERVSALEMHQRRSQTRSYV
jgi:hypothetical protein